MSSQQEFAKSSKKANRSKLPDLGDFQVQRPPTGGATAERDRKYTYFDLVSRSIYISELPSWYSVKSFLSIVSILNMRRALSARTEHDRCHSGLHLYTLLHTDLWRIHIPAHRSYRWRGHLIANLYTRPFWRRHATVSVKTKEEDLQLIIQINRSIDALFDLLQHQCQQGGEHTGHYR